MTFYCVLHSWLGMKDADSGVQNFPCRYTLSCFRDAFCCWLIKLSMAVQEKLFHTELLPPHIQYNNRQIGRDVVKGSCTTVTTCWMKMITDGCELYLLFVYLQCLNDAVKMFLSHVQAILGHPTCLLLLRTHDLCRYNMHCFGLDTHRQIACLVCVLCIVKGEEELSYCLQWQWEWMWLVDLMNLNMNMDINMKLPCTEPAHLLLQYCFTLSVALQGLK